MEEDQSAKAMEEMEVEDTKESQQIQHLPPSQIPPYSGQSSLLTADSGVSGSLKTGIGFHSAMLGHQCHCDDTRNHPEKPER